MWIKIALVGFSLLLSHTPLAAQSVFCDSVPPLVQVGITKEQRLDSLLRMPIACVRPGKPDFAVDIFSTMITIDPGNESAWLNRANAYLQTRQLSLGIADLSHVISVRPSFATVWCNRSTAFLAQRKYERALADFGQTLRLRPSFTRAYCNHGRALIRKGEYDMALDDLNKGLEKDPDLTLCRFARGDVYFLKTDYQKAVEDYTIGLAVKPNIEALSRRAEAYEKLGEKQKNIG